jgi:hypothetical protein
MMSTKDHSSTIAIVFLTVLALGVRVIVVYPAAFPLNDGGLFHELITTLVAKHFNLPTISLYNGESIPYAYPPLAFYIVGGLNQVFRIPLLQLLQFMPVLLSVACVPAFHLLAVEILQSRRQAALATLAFAFIPRTFDWLIMGGGITRALGLLLALLLMRQVVRLFFRRSRTAIVPGIIYGTLLVLSHPQAAAHAAITAGLFYVCRDRSRTGLRDGLITAAGIAVITAPWWLTVIARHGLEPFLSVGTATGADSYNSLVGLFALFRFDFTDEPFLRIFAVLGLLGLAFKIARREYLLAFWFVMLHLLEPRGGTLFMMIPLAMAAGFSLDAVVLPALGAGRRQEALPSGETTAHTSPWLPALLKDNGPRIALAFLTLYGCLSAFTAGSEIQQKYTLTARDARAFSWVREHTPSESGFALVTQGLPLRDAASEWFPALTGRRSIATVFGLEWVRQVDFARQIEQHRALQACAVQAADCLDLWAREYGQDIDYVYLRLENLGERSALHESLAKSGQFAQVYADGNLAIYVYR